MQDVCELSQGLPLYYLSPAVIYAQWVYKHVTARDRGIQGDRDMSTGAYVIDLCEECVCVFVCGLLPLPWQPSPLQNQH